MTEHRTSFIPAPRMVWDQIKSHSSRLARFSAVGATGVVVNSVLLALFVEAFGLPPILGAIFSTEGAILSNFVLNDHWTFGDISTHFGWLGRAWRYNAVALGGLAVSIGVMAMLTAWLHVYYLVANLIGIAFALLWNYAWNRRYTWSGPGGRETTATAAESRRTKQQRRLAQEAGRSWS